MFSTQVPRSVSQPAALLVRLREAAQGVTSEHVRPRARVRRAAVGHALRQRRTPHLLVRHWPPKGPALAEPTRPRTRPLPRSECAWATAVVRQQVRSGCELWGAECPRGRRTTHRHDRGAAHAARSRQDAMLAAAIHRSRGQLVCPGLPSGPERRALAASCDGGASPAHSR